MESNVPQNAAFTLKVPLDRDSKNYATFHIKDIDEGVFLAARALIEANKSFDAVRMVIKSLHVGGDNPEILNGNFVATNSAAKLVLQLIEPVEGELKKN